MQVREVAPRHKATKHFWNELRIGFRSSKIVSDPKKEKYAISNPLAFS